jgi:hypothetical protein
MSIFDNISKSSLAVIKRYCDLHSCSAKVRVDNDYTIYIEKDGAVVYFQSDGDLGFAASLLAWKLENEMAQGEHLLYRPQSLLNK